MSQFTGFDSKMKTRAQDLRRNMTRQEKKLWYEFLRDYPIKFYRQRSVGNYIVDFYCSKAKVVIELDGNQHYEPEEVKYDAKRTAYLAEYGLDVIRISNRDVDNNLRGVCEFIDKKVKERIQSLP